MSWCTVKPGTLLLCHPDDPDGICCLVVQREAVHSSPSRQSLPVTVLDLQQGALLTWHVFPFAGDALHSTRSCCGVYRSGTVHVPRAVAPTEPT